MKSLTRLCCRAGLLPVLLVMLLSTCFSIANGQGADTITVKMVALDQPFMFNRMGASQPTGQIFALERDIVRNSDNTNTGPYGPGDAGKVRLRDDKRPRPIVLRANKGQNVKIIFTNLMSPPPAQANGGTTYPSGD